MKKCIIVLGMHRSGTSALMGVLKIMGLEIGSNLHEPLPQNPKGFFELNGAIDINQSILGSLQSSWDSPYTLPENWWNKGLEFNEYKKEISLLIKTSFKDASIIGMKDPRFCRLIPIWLEVLEELCIKTYFIIPLRNPLEVAESLKKRNDICIEKSLILWMTHMLEAESYSRNYPRVITRFDELLRDSEKALNSISDVLKLDFPNRYHVVKGDISKFLDTGLKHHNMTTTMTDIMDNDLMGDIFDFYNILSQFANIRNISEDLLSKIDQIRERFMGLNSLFYNHDIKNELWLYSNQIHIIDEKNSVIEKQKSIIAKYESRFIYIPWLKRLDKYFRKIILYQLIEIFNKSWGRNNATHS